MKIIISILVRDDKKNHLAIAIDGSMYELENLDIGKPGSYYELRQILKHVPKIVCEWIGNANVKKTDGTNENIGVMDFLSEINTSRIFMVNKEELKQYFIESHAPIKI